MWWAPLYGLHAVPWQIECALKALHLCSERQQLLPIFHNIRTEFYIQRTHEPRTHMSDTGWGGKYFSGYPDSTCCSGKLRVANKGGFAKEICWAVKRVLRKKKTTQNFTNISKCCDRFVKLCKAHPYFQHWEPISTTGIIVFFQSIFYCANKIKTQEKQRKVIFCKTTLIQQALIICYGSFFLSFLICSWFTFFYSTFNLSLLQYTAISGTKRHVSLFIF